MSDVLDRLMLLITADATQGTQVVRGFGASTASELQKVEGAASASGGNAGSNFMRQFGASTTAGIAALQATVGTIGLTLFAKSSIADAIALDRANAELAVGLQTTGREAGTSNEQLNALAGTVQKTDAIFSGTVKSGEALLLTFQAIQNQAGAGNNIFDRTITVAASLSNVMGKDLNATVIQLGRALENPSAGMQALSRSGVTLDAQTRTLVTSLAKQGDLLGAQKALLDDLEPRYNALGAAAAKADPTQQFGVAIQQLKTTVGNDLLVPLKPALAIIGEMLVDFTALPGPIRAVGEGLALIGLVVKPLLLVKTALEGIAVARGFGAAAEDIDITNGAATRAAVGLETFSAEEAQAGATAAAASGQIFDMAAALDAYDAQLAVTIAEEEEFAAVTAGAFAEGFLAGAAGAGVLGIAIIGLTGILNQSHKSFDQVRGDITGIADDINTVFHSNAAFKLNPFHIGDVRQDQADLKSLNDGFIQIANTQGAAAATKAVQQFATQMEGAGVSAHDVYSAVGPAVRAINDIVDAANAAAGGTQDLDTALTSFAGSLAAIGDSLGIADKLDAVSTAEQKLKQDQEDLTGTSAAAVQANKDIQASLTGVIDAENAVGDAHQKLADAYTNLQDAQDKVTTSTHSLQEAQQALDLYNSARGAKERALALDALERRVVSTPAESDQKQLDLLNLQDTQANKKQQLGDAVVNASREQRDAIKAVADAERGITDAEVGLYDATNKVKTANEAVTIAVEKRKKVHDDAARAISGDERKVEQAIIDVVTSLDQASQKGDIIDSQITTWLTQLKKVADAYAPGSDLSKNVDSFYKKLGLDQQSVGDQAASSFFSQFKGSGLGVLSQSTLQRLFLEATGKIAGPYPPGDQQLLHQLGVPGFAEGGIVPGPRGTPRLILAHGGERVQTEAQQRGGTHVHQENHFHGSDTPAIRDLEYANRELGWRLGRSGRN